MSISSQLREAIKGSGESANSLAKKTGVQQSTITRFLDGAEMRTENIDRLAEYFGLKLCRDKKPPAKPKGKKA